MSNIETRAGKYYLTPAGKPADPYAAGWDGNVFDSEADAEAAIPELRNCGSDFDIDWAVRQYE